MVLESASRPFAATVSVILLAFVVASLVDLLDVRAATQARMAGASLLLLGVAFGVWAAMTWHDPEAFPEGAFPQLGPTARVVVALLAAVFFSLIGVIALVRGNETQR